MLLIACVVLAACLTYYTSVGVELTTCESMDFVSLLLRAQRGFQNYSANIYETLVEYEDGEISPAGESWT